MSLCINPSCTQPQNRDDELFCQTCGSELLLKGRYRVMRQLGGGGFGLTFEVNEVRSNTPKVIKVLIQTQQKAVDLFQQEAEVLSQLDNPGIPQVESDGYFVYFPRNSQNPVHCLVMEKIVGMDLEQYMHKRGLRPIDQDLAMQWLKELVIILDDVHSQNFFHRDIKPPNIMLRSTGELTLIDFGTARQVTATVVNQQGGVTMISSAGYTPVEQMNSQAVPQSDFFALGRTFIYLLTGKYPLDAAIYDAHNDEIAWRSHAPHISPLLADLLDEMMAHKPKQRPANAQLILQRLAQIEQALNPPKVTRRTNPPRVAPTQPVNPTQPQVKTPAPTLPVNPPQPPVTTPASTQLKPFGWGLWRQWMLANTVALLVWLGMFNMNQNQSSSDPLTTIMLVFLLPFTLWGSMQWLILKQLFPCKWWVFFTVLGTAIGFFLAALLLRGSYYDSRWVSAVFSSAVCGASLGLMQWFVLKRQIRLAGWWIVANAVGGMTVFYATMLGYQNSSNTGGLVFGSLAFTVFGAITGGTLVWLMRQSPIQANPSGVAATQVVNTPNPAKLVGWGWWLQWMLANTLSCALGFAVFNMNKSSSDPLTFLTLIFLFSGTLWGGMQWFILRRFFACKWWPLVTALGTAMGLFLGYQMGSAVYSSWGETGAITMGGAVCGAALGIMQWLVLRRQTSNTAWWILANAVAGMVIWYGFYFGYQSDNIVLIAVACIVYSAITCTTLVWLMRQPAVKY